jgi:hypothetical protein
MQWARNYQQYCPSYPSFFPPRAFQNSKNVGEDWRAPIMAYLCHYYELDSKNEQIRMQQRAKDYQIIGNELYKTFVSSPLLWCLSKT